VEGKIMKISNLCKSYGENVVYQNFNIEFENNKIACILGRSGSGKTTLLNAIAQLTSYSGEVDTTTCSYIFQTPRLVPNLTVKGNLSLVCKDEKKIKNILSLAEIVDKENEYPAKLSGGQAQRVSLCRAFLYEAQTLLMDEPFSSLDLKLKIKMMELFKSFWERDRRTVIFVTHDIDEALYLSDRIVLVEGGQVVLDEDNQRYNNFGEDSLLRRKILNTVLSI
jgi:NitT/TauT family transport system ATP-binding protein